METGYFILDVDCGVDDAYAILLAAAINPDHILAITTCYGNTSLDNVLKNTQAVMKFANLTKVPMFKGCSAPFLGNISDEDYFGLDGLNNVGHKYWIEGGDIPQETAANAMVRLASEYKGQITLVALAPLTNLVVAQQLCPEFSSMLRQTIILGGNYEGIGNINPSAEFNFHVDPIAATFVLKHFSCPIKIVPWETALQTQIPLKYFEELLDRPSKVSRFLKDISSTLIKFNREVMEQEIINLGDFYAVLVAFYPSVIVKSQKWFATVETASELTKGLCVVDRRRKSSPVDPFKEVEFILSMNNSYAISFLAYIFDKNAKPI